MLQWATATVDDDIYAKAAIRIMAFDNMAYDSKATYNRFQQKSLNVKLAN